MTNLWHQRWFSLTTTTTSYKAFKSFWQQDPKGSALTGPIPSDLVSGVSSIYVYIQQTQGSDPPMCLHSSGKGQNGMRRSHEGKSAETTGKGESGDRSSYGPTRRQKSSCLGNTHLMAPMQPARKNRGLREDMLSLQGLGRQRKKDGREGTWKRGSGEGC